MTVWGRNGALGPWSAGPSAGSSVRRFFALGGGACHAACQPPLAP
jgi:hypothetical protein